MANLISIKPNYCRMIYAGVKTVELRRRCSPSTLAGVQLYIYETSPTCAITGVCTVGRVQGMGVLQLKLLALKDAGVGSEEFDEYFSDAPYGYALFLSAVRYLREPITLSVLRDVHGIRPPQSYSRLAPALALKFSENEGFKLPPRHQHLDTRRRRAAGSGDLCEAVA